MVTRTLTSAICWSGPALISLFVIGRDESPLVEGEFEVPGMRPDRVGVYDLRDESPGACPSFVREYDLYFDDTSLDFAPYVETCLRRAASEQGAVAWAAFEGSFHFGHLLTDDVAEQIYGFCVHGGDPVVTWDRARLKSAEWTQRVREARAFLEAPG